MDNEPITIYKVVVDYKCRYELYIHSNNLEEAKAMTMEAIDANVIPSTARVLAEDADIVSVSIHR